MKKTLFILFAVIASVPCFAQWKNASMGGQILAFGVHDTSFFIGINPAGTQAPLVWRLGSLTPNVVWVAADNGIPSTQGNITSFASLGRYFFANQGQFAATYQTTNNGSSWLESIGSDIASNGHYLFGTTTHPFTTQPAYMARSRDSGVTWDSIANFNNGSWVVPYTTNGICIFAKVGNAIWRSRDTGNTWAQISPPFAGTITVMGSLLFIPGNGELAESTDSGSKWITVPVDSGSVPENVTCLATDGKNLFAGTPTGVLVSTDTGKDWTPQNDSLTYKNISAIAVFDTLLFIDVSNIGLNSEFAAYYRPISELTKPDSPASVVQIQSPDSLSIYPNPAMGTVTILAGGTSIEQIEMLNVLGKEVLSVPASHESEISLDISKLPSGTYFMQIQTANGIILRKIVKEE